jgi:Flp pilus assembly protein TadD
MFRPEGERHPDSSAQIPPYRDMPKSPHPAHDRPSTIGEALDRAAAALQSQRPDEAERLAAYVLKSNPAHVGAAQLLGQALLLQGRPEAAIDPLEKVVRRSQDPVIETLLARALADTGRGDEAEARLRQATTRRPPYAIAFLELGNRLGHAGHFSQAAAVFEEGLTLAPDAAVLRIALGYLHLQRNDRATARALFLQVRSVAPERHDAMVALANVMALDGEPAAAADLYRRAIALRPDEPTTRISLAKCLLELGEREAGETLLRGAARAGPGTAWMAIRALAAAPRGRLFLRPSAAETFLRAAR